MMADSELVHLRHGLTVTAPALRLLWHLENDGYSVRLQDTRLFVLPVDRLTPALCADIRRHRDELIKLVQYQPDDAHLFSDQQAPA